MVNKAIFKSQSLLALRGGDGVALFVLAFLENVAKPLVIVEVLLLAIYIRIHDDIAMTASDQSWLETDGTDCEVGSHIFSLCHFVGNQILIVACIWLCSETHQELCDIYCASKCGAVQRCVSILVSYVGSCPTVE